MLMNVIAGPDPADPTTIQSAPQDFLRTIGRSIRGLRVGIALPETLALVDPQIEQALSAAQSVFADLGCELVPIHVPDLDVLDAAAGIVLASEGSAQHARFMLEQGETYGKQIRVRLERGFAIPAPKYIDALRYRSVALQNFTASVFSAVDALILPVTAIRTPRIDESDVETGADIDDVVRQLTRFTRPLNYLGLPSLAVPIGFDSDGLPMSMQLVGRSLSEDLLLRLGHAYQTVCQWHLEAPQLPTNERQMT